MGSPDGWLWAITSETAPRISALWKTSRGCTSDTVADGDDGVCDGPVEWDYIWTNEEGQITRWDWFVDSSQWNPYLELIGLDPNMLTYQGYVANYLRIDADS